MRINKVVSRHILRFTPQLDWGSAKFLLASPLVRTAALLPLIGYLIIFSSEVSSWLDFETLGEPFFIPHEWKLRLVYYGGVLVIAAFCVYHARCPRFLKLHDSEDQLRDAPTRSGSVTELESISARWVAEASSNPTESRLDRNFFVFLAQYCKAVLRGNQKEYESAISEMQGQRIEALRLGVDPNLKTPEALSRFVDEYLGVLRMAMDGQGQIKRDPQIVQALHIVRWKALLGGLTGVAVDMANALYRFEFHHSRAQRPVSASLCVGLAALGLALICIPALETLVQVISLDVSGRFNAI